MNEIAECNGLKANHLSSCRTMARQGKPILPAPEDAVEFSGMVVEKPVQDPLPVKTVSRAEIIAGPMTIRLGEGATVARIAAIALALVAATLT